MRSACKSFQMLLSAYVDGEVSARERAQVEMHLSGCAECRDRAQDLRALSEAVAEQLDACAESVDFASFADQVMRRVTPERPGLLERLRVAWSEILTYHRIALVSSLATAAVTLAIAVPVAWQLASQSASPEVVLHDLKLDDPNVRPVVMNMGDGKTLIMLVRDTDETNANGEEIPDLDADAPTGGDL
jgi:anti-sigma factor RsiW